MKHYTDFDSPAGALGCVLGGRYVRSDVPESDDVPWTPREVFLNGGDAYCDACRTLIDPDEWYGAGWVNVLARQKQKHGGTWCGACFAERDVDDQADTEDANEQDADTNRPGRTFD